MIKFGSEGQASDNDGSLDLAIDVFEKTLSRKLTQDERFMFTTGWKAGRLELIRRLE